MNLWVFDNDGTLYNDFGAGKKFMEILVPYAANLLQIPQSEAEKEIPRLKNKWQTDFTALALVKELGIDLSEFVANTYLKIDLGKCGLVRDDSKVLTLESIKSPKIVFTNNPSSFAKYVLSYLGLSEQFVDFIGMQETNFNSKPNPLAYQEIERLHPGFNKVFFCDDSLQNLDSALRMGWTTFWIKPPESSIVSTKHITIESFPELLNYI
jgi:FMN phosphatase YigB (HAD superfamily)